VASTGGVALEAGVSDGSGCELAGGVGDGSASGGSAGLGARSLGAAADLGASCDGFNVVTAGLRGSGSGLRFFG